MRKTIICIYSVTLLSILGCNVKTIVLKDGITRVPKNNNVFKSKERIVSSMYSDIDTSVVYFEFDVNKRIMKDIDYTEERSVFGCYRFYPNGSFNYFILVKNKIEENDFNSIYNGYRGVYYVKNNKLMYDLYAPINQLGWIGKQSGTINFKSDTLIITSEIKSISTKFFIKKKVPNTYLLSKSTW